MWREEVTEYLKVQFQHLSWWTDENISHVRVCLQVRIKPRFQGYEAAEASNVQQTIFCSSPECVMGWNYVHLWCSWRIYSIHEGVLLSRVINISIQREGGLKFITEHYHIYTQSISFNILRKTNMTFRIVTRAQNKCSLRVAVTYCVLHIVAVVFTTSGNTYIDVRTATNWSKNNSMLFPRLTAWWSEFIAQHKPVWQNVWEPWLLTLDRCVKPCRLPGFTILTVSGVT
jgi:hypothetical protein